MNIKFIFGICCNKIPFKSCGVNPYQNSTNIVIDQVRPPIHCMHGCYEFPLILSTVYELPSNFNRKCEYEVSIKKKNTHIHINTHNFNPIILSLFIQP